MVENSEHIFWLEKEIVPKIAEAMGRDVENLRCEIVVPTDSFFVSAVYMVDLIFSENERIKLVVKVQPTDEATRACMRTDILFHNEIIFYNSFGRNYIDYPKCVLTISEPISMAVIVLENAGQFGYKAMNSKEDVEMKRAMVAVREIGRFHARGYVLKEKKPHEFFGVVGELREIHDDSAPTVTTEFFNTVSLRPVNYLRSVNYDPAFCDRMSIFLSNAYEKIFKDCVKPRNELAVLCHGDFTVNNVLFREKDDGEVDAMLIDFAQFRYASPATDLSTFLYLSCEENVRKNFPIIFKAYHDTILEHLAEHGVKDLGKYCFEAFLKDYKRHAIIGCEIAIFFIPVMNLDHAMSFDELTNNTIEHFTNVMASGGEPISKRLADMLLELKGNGCLDHVT